MTNPLLSIVIANYNYGRFLESAIRSVLGQDMGNKVELIICDAASTDDSVEIIKKYADHIAWWCSEKDGGQSAAFNKGFRHARGEWLTWLNADDLLLPGAVAAFAKLVSRKPSAEWVTGNKLGFDSETGKITSVNWGPHWQPPFLNGKRAFSAVFGPTTFFKRSLYERMGPVDESLHYAMDSAYWAKLTMAGIRQTRLWHICWAFRVHNESKTAGVQSADTTLKRKAETARWRSQIGYFFPVDVTNIWWLMWVIWRVIDASWLVRTIQKNRYLGKNINQIMEFSHGG